MQALSSPRSRSSRRRRRRPPLRALLAAAICALWALVIFRSPAVMPASAGPNVPSRPAASGSSSARGSAGPASPSGLTPLPAADVHSGALVLVNADCPYVPPQSQTLVTVLDGKNDAYLVRDGSILLDEEALDALNRLMADFAAQGGERNVNVVAGFRTEEFQQHLFDQSAAANGLDHALRYVAQPGHSEHQTGYALDFSLYDVSSGASADFTGAGEQQWIADHAPDYGFVLRYGADKEAVTGIAAESWHYRYVGVPHAHIMTDRGLCLEEYWDLLRAHPYNGEHLRTTVGGTAYEIWYCPTEALYVPEAGDYALSGDNVGGFAVTAPAP